MFYGLGMNNVAAKTAARITPNNADIVSMLLRFIREDAERAGDQATEHAADSIGWFCATGRAFLGLQRVMQHMSKSTLKAFVARVAKGMAAEGKAKRGPMAEVVAGDMSNIVLARAIGCADVQAAEAFCCNHPHARQFTLGGADARKAA
jgi:hypothetical protein